MKQKRVLFLYTGGTIGMDLARGHEGEEHATLGERPKDLVAEVPALRQLACVDTEPVFNHDSADLQPHHWVTLALRVHRAFAAESYDGVVVVHGTDTMAYGAGLLAFLLGPLPGPVVFTGSQRPFSDIRSDAVRNLVDACLVATLPVPEVCLVFGGRVFRGVRATKIDAWGFEAFASPNCRPIVELGIGWTLNDHVRKPAPLLPLDARVDPHVLSLPVFPGLNPQLLIGALRGGTKGVVLSTYGTGTMPRLEGSLLPVLEEAKALQVPVLVVSQCNRGFVELGRYAGGAEALERGAISGGDMTVEAALAKMMVALGRFTEKAALRAFLERDFLGERS